jgi:hypothetical protein
MEVTVSYTPRPLTAEERPSVPTGGLVTVEKRKAFCYCRELNYDYSIDLPVGNSYIA